MNAKLPQLLNLLDRLQRLEAEDQIAQRILPDGEHAVAFFAFENIHLPDNPVNRQIHSARHEPGKGQASYENQRSNQ
ncbi:hypothetical protein D3C73_824370 [compost metagenome]